MYHSKNNLNFKMTTGQQTYNFCYIEDVIQGIFDCLNFKKKNKSFPQEWDLAHGKGISVKNFAKKIWKKNNSTAKILFSKIKNYEKENYLPNKKKLWKIKFRQI